MNELERKMLEAFKETVKSYNIFWDDKEGTLYRDGLIEGMKEIAASIGYVLSANHKRDIVGLPFESVSIAKNGVILAEIEI